MSVTFEGQIDSVLGGFVCIRGFASFKKLAENSEVNIAANYQRDLISEHRDEIKKFMDDGAYLFFPEIILSYTIDKDIYSILNGGRLKSENINIIVRKNKTATLKLEKNAKLTIIDGNHRLKAYELNESLYSSYNFPFCIIILNSQQESIKKENILFHNINFKQIPLTKEKSLEILFQDDIYSDGDLKSMGLEYLITKKILDEIKQNKSDYEGLPFDYSNVQKKTMMYNAITFLIENTGLQRKYYQNQENEIRTILKCLQKIAQYYKENYKTKGSNAMFSVLLYYQYENSIMNPHAWLFENCIHNITDNNLQPQSLKILYESALQNKINNMWQSTKSWAGFIWKLNKLLRPFMFWRSK